MLMRYSGHSCAAFDLYDQSGPDKCIAGAFVDEQVTGTLATLPGNNLVTRGPDRVTTLPEVDPPRILESVRFWGGRVSNHSVDVRRASESEEGRQGAAKADDQLTSLSEDHQSTMRAGSGSNADQAISTSSEPLKTGGNGAAETQRPMDSDMDTDTSDSSINRLDRLSASQLALLAGGAVLVLLCAILG